MHLAPTRPIVAESLLTTDGRSKKKTPRRSLRQSVWVRFSFDHTKVHRVIYFLFNQT
ncbi:hypothetical protein HOV93_26790 [Planctomycetes bacterium FF15]|uniref:Uncharacterized protein n=1 Tax=Bremerella alba TaxID=980252 RepID=A0A7V8V5S1_9BACT|nr:hypothetical protein [Bremerella alba]